MVGPVVSIISVAVTSLLLAQVAAFHSVADDRPPAPAGDVHPIVGDRQPGELIAASFNIRYGTAADGPDRWSERRDRCIAAIRELDADILGLQEVLLAQRDEIVAALPAHRMVGVGRDDGVAKGEFSPILFRIDRFRLLEHGTFWLSETPDTPGSRSWGNTLPRICTWALLEEIPSSRRLRVFNTHFDHESQHSREHSAAALRARVDSVPKEESVILLGDLNAGPENPAFRTLLGLAGAPRPLQDAWRLANPESPEMGTFHAFTGTANRPRIDVILVDASIVIHAVAIDHRARDGRFPSDHFAVAARLGLKPVTSASDPTPPRRDD